MIAALHGSIVPAASGGGGDPNLMSGYDYKNLSNGLYAYGTPTYEGDGINLAAFGGEVDAVSKHYLVNQGFVAFKITGASDEYNEICLRDAYSLSSPFLGLLYESTGGLQISDGAGYPAFAVQPSIGDWVALKVETTSGTSADKEFLTYKSTDGISFTQLVMPYRLNNKTAAKYYLGYYSGPGKKLYHLQAKDALVDP